MIIGITGSIGSGKTSAARIFGRRFYSRIDADGIGHEIMKKKSDAYKKITIEFGKGILDKNKNIDRGKLGDIVFNDINQLRKLNSITHPAIINEIKNRIQIIKRKCGDKSKIAIDAPLLLETNAKNIVDKIVVVKCSKKNIIDRLNKKYTKEKIERILKLQMPLEKKLKYADFVIDNNNDLKHLEEQVENIVRIIEE